MCFTFSQQTSEDVRHMYNKYTQLANLQAYKGRASMSTQQPLFRPRTLPAKTLQRRGKKIQTSLATQVTWSQGHCTLLVEHCHAHFCHMDKSIAQLVGAGHRTVGPEASQPTRHRPTRIQTRPTQDDKALTSVLPLMHAAHDKTQQHPGCKCNNAAKQRALLAIRLATLQCSLACLLLRARSVSLPSAGAMLISYIHSRKPQTPPALPIHVHKQTALCRRASQLSQNAVWALWCCAA
eukprot:1141517-Pelagomonas_calceolata.AAC.3